VLNVSHTEIAPGVVVLKLAGRLMLGQESEPIPQLIERWVAEGKRTIIVDLSGVTHIDSTGIGRFIASFNAIQRSGGKLLMAGASGQVRDGFRVTRLDTVFPFFDSVEEASRSLNG